MLLENDAMTKENVKGSQKQQGFKGTGQDLETKKPRSKLLGWMSRETHKKKNLNAHHSTTHCGPNSGLQSVISTLSK